MNIETLHPIHPQLKTLIEYYYFQKTNPDFSVSYFSFPNTLHALNIHRNIQFQIDGNNVRVKGGKQSNYTMLLNGRYTLPLHVQQYGEIDKVTIAFKPLGLNHFIQGSFIEVAKHPTQAFTEWIDEDENCQEFLMHFFDESDNRCRVAILENYLLSKYRSFAEKSFLTDVIAMLTDFDSEVSIENIAKETGLSSRTLDRIFKKHLGISPITFRKIARFRHSLRSKLIESKFKTLTGIVYESNFYDQSYFNRVYKHLTGQSPKRFFQSIDTWADQKLVYQFITE